VTAPTEATLNELESDPRLSGRALHRVAFNEQQIQRRVAELGREITNAYPDGELLVLGCSREASFS
jgi:Hypoxanthine-guanine phosphoribosyltransferase